VSTFNAIQGRFHSRSGYDLWRGPGLATLIAVLLGSASAFAQGQVSQKACSLLTPAELGAAIGGAVEQTSGREIPFRKDEHHDHDGAVYICTSKLGSRYVYITFSTSPVTAEGKKQDKAQVKTLEDKMRQQGYQIKPQSLGSTKCLTILPPSGGKLVAGQGPGTNCTVERGAYFVSLSITATSQSDLFPLDKLRRLAEMAASRLP